MQILSVLDREAVLYLKTVDITKSRYGSHAEGHAPLDNTAAGKVFLPQMSDRRRLETWSKLKFDRFIEITKPYAEGSASELIKVCRKGFANAFGKKYCSSRG